MRAATSLFFFLLVRAISESLTCPSPSSSPSTVCMSMLLILRRGLRFAGAAARRASSSRAAIRVTTSDPKDGGLAGPRPPRPCCWCGDDDDGECEVECEALAMSAAAIECEFCRTFDRSLAKLGFFGGWGDAVGGGGIRASERAGRWVYGSHPKPGGRDGPLMFV